MIIIDRETGRGVIVQTQSCTVSIAGAGFCNEARPISINGDLGLIENDPENDATGEGINLDVTNNYNVSADGDGVHLDYESRNSVSPLPAISGDVTFQPDGDGDLSITHDDRDNFPAYSTYQYQPGEPDHVIEHNEAGSPIELITPPDLPDLPNLPDLPGPAAGPPGPARPAAAPASAQPAEPARSPRPAGPSRPAGAAAEPPEPAQPAGPAGMTGMPHTMRRLAPRPRSSRSPAAAARREAAEAPTATPAATVTPDPAAGSFPDRPQVVEKFSRPGLRLAARRLSRRRLRAPRARLRGRARAASGSSRPPAARSPRSSSSRRRGGAAGLLCRASDDGGTGYGLLLGADGKVQLLRLDGGKVRVIKQHRLTPNERSDRGKPSLLRLGCGTGEPGKPLTLIYSINATPFGYVTDRESIDPGRSARVGLLARDGVARFDDFALYLAT